MNRLAGKTAFLTAAGAGIGLATALAFAREGARLVATDIDQTALDRLAAQVALVSSGRHVFLRLDVTDHASLRAAADAHSRCNVLFNCAGFVHEGTLQSTTPADWQRSIDINITSMFVLTQAFVPHFISNGGASIISMSSVASSLKGFPNRFVYSVTKAAVLGFTKSVAADYLKNNIRANAICPGTIQSPSLEGRINNTPDPVAARAAYIARQPMGRLGTAEEIANIAVYLASDESAYTTGTWITADGGITL